MKLKQITGHKGRPKVIDVNVIDGKVTVPHGEWVVIESNDSAIAIGTEFQGE